MKYLIITEFDVMQSDELTEEIKKAQSVGSYDVVRMSDGLVLSSDSKNWESITKYEH